MTKDEAFKVFIDFIRSEGLKMTWQRKLVFDLFVKAEGHFSVEDLFMMVRRENSEVGFSTVYRTVLLLKKAGLARQVNFDARQSKYESSLKLSHHDHLVCSDCGKVVEFYDDQIEEIQRRIAKKHKFLLMAHQLEMFGLCINCRQQSTKRSAQGTMSGETAKGQNSKTGKEKNKNID